MNEIEYERGDRTAWVQMLKFCMGKLGHDSPESNEVRWVLEREAVIAQLRILCEMLGDNDWESDEYLPDVIQKHLARHLNIVFNNNDKNKSKMPCPSRKKDALDPAGEQILQKSIAALENLKIPYGQPGLTIEDICDLTGFKNGFIRCRIDEIVENGKLCCIEGAGRRPAYYVLPQS